LELCKILQWPAKFKTSARFGALTRKVGTLQSFALACKIQNIGTIRRSDLQVWNSAESCNDPSKFKTSARLMRRSDLQIWNYAESCNGLQKQM